jgi:hypothetical protein
MSTPSSSAQNRTISVWFQKIENGEIKLPRFQRHQAWDSKRICSLLNTATQNLPLGVALILDVDKEQFVSRYLVTAPETGGRVTEHLLDGQQRLTALWRSLHNNYESTKFFLYFEKYNIWAANKNGIVEARYKNRRRDERGRMTPLWADNPKESFKRGKIPMDLFKPGDNYKAIEEWVDQALEDMKPQASEGNDSFAKDYDLWSKKKDEVRGVIRSIKETLSYFNLPFLALPSQTEKDTALQVFINMNTNSKPLSRHDIIRAEIEGVRGVSLDELENNLDEKYPVVKYYFELSSLVLATSALMQDKPPSQPGMLNMSKEKMVDNWDRMALGLSKMASFMESQGVFDKARLPTNAVLAVIAALYTLAPKDPDSQGRLDVLLKKYLWSSFFTDRYENSAATHAYADFIELKKLIHSESIEEHTESDVPVLNRELSPLATVDELCRVGWPKRATIRGRGIMAIFSKLGAYDFANGSPLTRQQLISGARHYHHIFPASLLRKNNIESDFALNCALITDKTNLNISNKDPLCYLKDRYNCMDEEIVNERLQSHLIPIDELKLGSYEGLDEADQVRKDFSSFIEKRAKYVVKAVEILTEGRDITASQIIHSVER